MSLTKQQKRIFCRSTSFCIEARSRGCQLFWVGLTTALGGDRKKLALHYQELRRRAERDLHYYIEYLTIETTEGNGVLHQIWAIKTIDNKPAWIPHPWLSGEWEDIHGAYIVHIQRMWGEDRGIYNVSRYMIQKYITNQAKLVRMSWSWKRSKISLAKGWNFFKRYVIRNMMPSDCGVSTWHPNIEVTYQEMIRAWRSLLTLSQCTIGGRVFIVFDRNVLVSS